LNLQALKITLYTEHALRRIPPLTVILTGENPSRSFTIICAGCAIKSPPGCAGEFACGLR